MLISQEGSLAEDLFCVPGFDEDDADFGSDQANGEQTQDFEEGGLIRDDDSLGEFLVGKKAVFKGKKVLTKEDEVYLAKLKDEGNLEARNILIEMNLGLVVKIARMYLGRGVDFSDLVQEGNIGLIRAVEGFDHTKGNKLATYANWWIFQSIERALCNSRSNIRLPVYVHDALKAYRDSVNHLYHKLERRPDISEIANLLNTSEEVVDFLATYVRPELSINHPILGEHESDDKKTFDYFLENKNNLGQDMVSMARESRELILGCMRDSLTFEEMAVMAVRWEAWEHFSEYWKCKDEAMSLVGRVKRRIENDREVSPSDADVFFGIVAKDDLEYDKEKKIMKTAHRILTREEATRLLWWIGCGGEVLTLQNIGDLLGITREAVRQREKLIRQKLLKRIKRSTGLDVAIDQVSKEKPKSNPESKKMNLQKVRFPIPGNSIKRVLDSHFVRP